MIDAVLEWSDRFARAVAALAAVMIAGIAVLILAEVTLRSLVNTSLPYAWEYSSYLNGMAVFCGAAFTLRHAGHVRVQLLAGRAESRGRRVLELVATTLGLLAAGFVAYGLVILAVDFGAQRASLVDHQRGAAGLSAGHDRVRRRAADRADRAPSGAPDRRPRPEVISAEYTVD